jgi:hypothetical protein
VQMDMVIDDLESKFHTAEEKNWKLLIAAIGAELDALRQGRTILEGVLGAPEPEQEPELGGIHNESAIASEMESGDEIRGLDKSFETARRRMSNGDTDDEPDPELLFSTHDTDTE